MKRRGLLLAVILVSLLSISLVSATNGAGGVATEVVSKTNEVINDVVGFIEPISEQVLGKSTGIGEFTAGEMLFAKVLFFIIILSVVWMGLSKIEFFSDKTWVLWIVGIGVSILSTRWIGDKLIPTILLPYTTLGVAIAAAFPFVIYFAIVNLGLSGNKYKTIRKIAWVFFAVIFVVFWITRSESLGSAQWIYPITALVSLIMLKFDGTIQHIIGRMDIEKKMSVANYKIYTQMLNEIEELKHLRKDAVKRGEKGTIIKDLDKRIDRLTSEAAAMK